MFFLFIICMTVFTMYVDAICCMSVKHRYNWKTSMLSALFWPVTLIIVIIAVVKETKEY